MGQARNRRAAGAAANGVQTVALSERTTTRLLERYCLAQGARQAAAQAVAAANALEQRYHEALQEVADAPVGAGLHVDFPARTITITPGGSAAPSEGGPPDERARS